MRHLVVISVFILGTIYAQNTRAGITDIFDTCSKIGCFDNHCQDTQQDGTKNPSEYAECVGGMCATCEVTGVGSSSWADPKIQILFTPSVYKPGGMQVYVDAVMTKTILKMGECKYMAGLTRFCARSAPAGKHGNDKDPAATRLCAYEDPKDAHDSNSSRETDHKGSENHIVITEIGCTDMHTGPPPPAWSHKLWLDNQIPDPIFVEDTANSVFESPKIEVRTCLDTNTNAAASCDDANTTVIGPSPVLNPNHSNNYKDCVNSSGDHVTNPTPANTNFTERVYCATITQATSDKIDITMLYQDEWRSMQTMNRPGYIPQPTIAAASNSTKDAAKVVVTLRGQSITLDDDPGLYLPTPEPTSGLTTSGYLHQVRFSTTRPCAPGMEKYTNVNYNGQTIETLKCTQYKNIVCVQGYDTAPLTVVKKISTPSTIQDNKPISGNPNVLKVKDTAFANNFAYQEKGQPLDVIFKKDVLILNPNTPTKCYKYSSNSANSYCQNYSGACIPGDSGTIGKCNQYSTEHSSALLDPWYIDTAKNKVRPMSPAEADLCVAVPPDKRIMVYSYSSNTQRWVAPVNCGSVKVKLWGGGAAGDINVRGGTHRSEDYAGSAGGYIEDVIEGLQGGEIFNINVARGGSTTGATGGTSRVSIDLNGTVTTWSAFGGLNPALQPQGANTTPTGSVSPDNNTKILHAGAAGANVHRTNAAGGLAYQKNANPQNDCYRKGLGVVKANNPGEGGCAEDSNSSGYKGAWGKGGDGEVRMQCIDAIAL